MKQSQQNWTGIFFGLMAFLISVPVSADMPKYSITIKNHQFMPSEITIEAGNRVKLFVFNDDDTAEEFESYSLNREKLIAGKSKAKIYIGPLDPGRYEFFGEFNRKTAQGVIIVK
jgi:plastocyanin